MTFKRRMTLTKNDGAIKKIIPLMLCAIISLSAMNAMADYGTRIGEYTWIHETIDDLFTEIVGISPKPAGSLAIPTSLDFDYGKINVTSIKANVFSACSNLTSIIVPNADYYNIIEQDAFSRCDNLEFASIGNYVTVKSGAFSDCKNLSIVEVAPYAEIQGGAFCRCDNLKAFVVQDSNANGLILSNQGRQLVCGVNGHVTIPDSVTMINDNAFLGLRGLISVQMPRNLYTIGENSFSGCSSLSSITIPDSVHSIGAYSFFGCNSLKCLYIGENVNRIGHCAFAGCTGLTAVSVHENNPAYVARNGLLLTKDRLTLVHGLIATSQIPNEVTCIGNSAYQASSILTNLEIPVNVTNIGSQAFRDCVNLESISIPNTVQKIGWAAFDKCSSLVNVALPEGLTCIEYGTFSGCAKLQSVIIPDSVQCIQETAFADCNSITSITIPSSVTNIGYQAFRNCNNLSTVCLPNKLCNRINVDWVFQGCSPKLKIIYKDDDNLNATEYTYSLSDLNEATIIGVSIIPEVLEIPSMIDGHPVVAIGAKAFQGCTQIKKVVIPNSVKNIGAYAFQYCDGIESIVFGNGIVEISQWAFSYCNKLKNITLENELKTIAQYAFGYCDALETVILPRSVKDIKWGAFARNPSLSTVYFPDSFKGKGSAGMFEDSPNVARIYYACQNPITPPMPTSLSATDDGPHAIRLDWEGDASYEISCYKIYRAENESFENSELIAEVMPDEGTIFFDYGVSPDSIYNYWIVSVNDIFESEPAGPAFGCCEDYFYIDENTKLPIGFVAENYEFQLKAIFDNGHLSWGIDEIDNGDGWIESLPKGMSLSPDGLISGVPATAGTYNLWINLCDVRFLDSGSSLGAPLTLVVRERGKPCIIGSSPEGFAPVVLRDGGSQLFSVEATDFAGNNLTYSWVVDGVKVQSGTKSTYRLRTNGDKSGTIHEVVCFANNDNSSGEMSRKWIVKIPAGTFYVNATTGDDAHDGLTKETALASIQAAIDKTVDGDTIIVADGVYAPITTRNRKIVIQSENGYKNAIIDGGGEANCALLGGPESFVEGEPEAYGELWQGTNTVLRGFTLRNGRAAWGAGVTAGTVENCLIVSNTVEAYPWNSPGPNGLGGGAYLSVLRNCTIVDNTSSSALSDEGEVYGGIDGGSCACTLFNCIEWGNTDDVDEGEAADIAWWQASAYENCCRDNPHFADALNGDFRLRVGSPAVVDGAAVAGCEFEIVSSEIPELTENEVAEWVSSTLATRYIKEMRA